MEVGALEGMVRHEYRGAVAAERAGKKLIEFLASDEVDSETALKIIDTLVAVQEGDDPLSRQAVLVKGNETSNGVRACHQHGTHNIDRPITHRRNIVLAQSHMLMSEGSSVELP